MDQLESLLPDGQSLDEFVEQVTSSLPVAGESQEQPTPVSDAVPDDQAEVAEETVTPEDPVKDEEVSGGGKEAAAASWFTDEDREYAQQFGLGDADLQLFADRSAFRQATSLADRLLAKPPAQATATPAAEKPAGEEVPAEEVALDPEKLAQAGWDEEAVRVVKALNQERSQRKKLEQEQAASRKQLEEVVAFTTSLRQQQEAERQARSQAEFHDTLDGFPELFGKSADAKGNHLQLTPVQEAARKKIYDAASALHAGLLARAQQTGQQPSPLSVRALVQRAVDMEMGGELRKLEQAKTKQAATAQSARRRPVSGSKPNPASAKAAPTAPQVMDHDSEVNAVMATPEIQALLASLR